MKSSEKKIAALIFARLDSSRLPAKAMLKFGKETLLNHVISQTLKIFPYDTYVLTTDRYVDDFIADSARKKKVGLFRGDLDNVAKRIADFLNENPKYNYFIRLNGDSPFLDKGLVGKAIANLQQKKYDLVSNLIDRKYPYGISVEIVKTERYLSCYEKYTDNKHFEHPTTYFYEYLHEINYKSISMETDYSHLKMTIDTLDDYICLRKLYELHPDFDKQQLTEKIKLFLKFK